MALFDHDEGDIEVKILGFESDWKKRRVKEAIAISKIKPNLNDDDGLKLSAIIRIATVKNCSGNEIDRKDVTQKTNLKRSLCERQTVEHFSSTNIFRTLFF